MTLPNFIVIGSAKSATTSLYHYLNQHPEIYMSPDKEPSFFIYPNENTDDDFNVFSSKKTPNFFNSADVTNIDEYMSLFRLAKMEKAIGEASPCYIYDHSAAKRIMHFIPNAKLIAIFRNPFEAAYSNFIFHKNIGWEKRQDFLETLKKENLKDANPWSEPFYIRLRFYDDQVEQYLKIFPKSQMCFLLYEDLQNPQEMFRRVFRFLRVNENFQPDTSLKHNIGGQMIKNPLFHFVTNNIPISIRNQLKFILPPFIYKRYMNYRLGVKKGSITKAECPPEAKEFLYPIFKPHILRLQDMIGRDLSEWLK